MDVYGLTGGIGSGKSKVAEYLEDFGVPVVSADELSRVVVSGGSEGLGEVVRAFGRDVLDERGELDRRKMASIVFAEPARRQQLESILHPRIRERFEQVLDALEKAGHVVTVYEVPLLFEKNLQSDMKATILVTADEDVRIRRVMERDQVTESEVRDRIATQMPEPLKRRRADYIIENNGTADELRREVRFLLERFLRIDARLQGGVADPGTAPSAATTEIPTDPRGGTQPPIDPAVSAQTPAPPPGLHLPTPAGPPSAHPTEPPTEPPRSVTQRAPVVPPDESEA